MEKCDCLNDCGDDSRVAAAKVAQCNDYERLHRYGSAEADAARYRWLCEHPDWTFMERICQRFPAQSAAEFYRRLSAEIDRMGVSADACTGA